jgi:hypothetical protein
VGLGEHEPSGAERFAQGHAEGQPQRVGAVELAGQKEPAGQPAQVAFDAAPRAGEKVPPGQGVALTEAHGQKEPAGQRSGAPPEAQKEPAGHGVHVRERMRWFDVSAMTRAPDCVISTPLGSLKSAAVPKPSAHEAVAPTPARVLTTPAETMRTAPPSSTTRFPAASTATSRGKVKVALVVGPSAKPAAPEPAKVVTSPAGVTLRMQLFTSSVTYAISAESMAMPHRLAAPNFAFEPIPFTKPPVDPASVETTPAGYVAIMTLAAP